MGMIFFGFIFLMKLGGVFIPFLLAPWILFFIFLCMALATSFGLYLAFIQFAVIKKKCSWCLLLALLAFVILVLSWFAGPLSYITLLGEYRTFVLVLHVASMALGLGGATITDFFFFKFLKDLKISKYESNILSNMSEFIWIALAIATLSGIGLFLPGADGYLDSSKFLTKMAVIFVIIVNGIFLNLFISPQLASISFRGKTHKHYKGELLDLRRFAFASGAISISSWYTAFILGMTRSIPLPTPLLLLGYLLLLILAVAGSQVAEYIMCRRKKSKKH